MDGMSLWKSLSENSESPRNLMLHNIDDTRHIAAVRVGDWKLMKGSKILNVLKVLIVKLFPIFQKDF
jgi:hypothetical protein